MKSFNQVFRDDLHLHLFGCLSSEDVWNFGKKVHTKCSDDLQWYCDEYAKAFGVRPPVDEFWTDDEQGLKTVEKFYEIKDSVSFAQFQACFNLVIALFKNRNHDLKILETVCQKHESIGMKYAEYRVPFPHRLDSDLCYKYLNSMSEFIETWENGDHHLSPRIVLSLPRNTEQAVKQYQFIKSWQNDHPRLASYLVGIDFSGDEETSSPSTLEPLFRRLQADNAQQPQNALALLLHVGETFEITHLRTSIQRVWHGCTMGAHRLGHALSLGIDPILLKDREAILECSQNVASHVNWLKENCQVMRECGYTKIHDDIEKLTRRLRTASRGLVRMTYDEEELDSLRQLQNSVLFNQQLPRPPIECCPTSNLRIGPLHGLSDHPLIRFMEADWPVVIAADDPGIFSTNVAREAQMCFENLGLDEEIMNKLACLASVSRSTKVAKSSPNYPSIAT